MGFKSSSAPSISNLFSGANRTVTGPPKGERPQSTIPSAGQAPQGCSKSLRRFATKQEASCAFLQAIRISICILYLRFCVLGRLQGTLRALLGTACLVECRLQLRNLGLQNSHILLGVLPGQNQL